jgi:erythronate-4-phosphate dehydrogenase
MYNILVDENIPIAKEAFSGFGKVNLAAGREMTNALLKKIDILIIRSVTKVNKSLLNDTAVKFVGTTTIGLDHLDVEYLEHNKIGFANSPGCNANSVAEYVFAGLLRISLEKKFNLSDKSIAIIGYGNIGSKVAWIAKSFGMKIFINDPPLQRTTGQAFFVSYEEALKADIITFHVPLNIEGIDKTYHMLSDSELKKFNDQKIIINASRGSVVSNDDLKKFLLKNNNSVILDVWENEPGIDLDLLKQIKIGTPHIAGYSTEGKVNGTKMIYNALCKFLNINPEWTPDLPAINNPVINYQETENIQESLHRIISEIYNIESDDVSLREICNLKKNEQGKYFDQLRKKYPVRREFSNFSIRINSKLKKEIKILEALRFKIIQS